MSHSTHHESADDEHSEAWAEVRATDQVIRYRRSGAGRPVILLASLDEGSLWPEVRRLLLAGGRVITPDVEPDVHAAARLAAFIEGLGLAGTCVIAVGSFCTPALELALLVHEQIARVVLVTEGDALDSALDGRLTTDARLSPLRLLLLRRGTPAAQAMEALREFVG